MNQVQSGLNGFVPIQSLWASPASSCPCLDTHTANLQGAPALPPHAGRGGRASKGTAGFHPHLYPCISGLMEALRYRLCEEFSPFQVPPSTPP